MQQVYKSQWLAQGVMLSDYPLELITCQTPESEAEKLKEQNSIKDKQMQDVISNNIADITKQGGYEAESIEPEKYRYHGIKSPSIKIPLNGDSVDMRLFMNLGFNPSCNGGGLFRSYTSIYAEVLSNLDIKNGKLADYFNELNMIAKKWTDKILKEYSGSGEFDYVMPFCFKMFGLDIPKEHIIRDIFFYSKDKKTRDELREMLSKDKEAIILWQELKDIHGEQGEEEYFEQHSAQSGFEEKLNWFFHSSVLDEVIKWTGFSDIPSAEVISGQLEHHPLEELVIFNRFGEFKINLDKDK